MTFRVLWSDVSISRTNLPLTNDILSSNKSHEIWSCLFTGICISYHDPSNIPTPYSKLIDNLPINHPATKSPRNALKCNQQTTCCFVSSQNDSKVFKVLTIRTWYHSAIVTLHFQTASEWINASKCTSWIQSLTQKSSRALTKTCNHCNKNQQMFKKE